MNHKLELMKGRLLLLIAFCTTLAWASAQPGSGLETGDLPELNNQNYRTFDGSYNNLTNTFWGAAGTNLRRITEIGYSDGISAPAGLDRPNPRYLSNEIFAQENITNDKLGLSDYCWVFGQFIDHDIGLTPDGNEPAMINVPAGDPWFDPMNSGRVLIPMVRNVFDPETGTGAGNPRQHPNMITAFIDGSGVYGSDEETANWLRSFSGGKLKASADNMLPFNTLTGEFDSEIDPNAPHMDDAVGLSDKLYVAGDPRANENPLLLGFHTIFMREHNRLCDELAVQHPDWDDERLYQHARKMVGGFIQSIVFNEWLPAMGVSLESYRGYQEDINPQLSNVFTAAAFRLGHTLLNGNLIRMKNDGQIMEEGNIGLREAFFNPMIVVESGGIEPFLKGMGVQVQQQMDSKIIDDVRNFLFGPPGAGGLDLAAININRGRERGLPDFNTIRANLGLRKYFFFQQMDWNYNILIKMVKTYKNVNKVDPWVGMLVERPRPGKLFGETIMTIMEEQFGALRDGDRFFYENDPVLSDDEKRMIRNTTMYDVLMRNTRIELMQRNVFKAMPHDQICKERPGFVFGTVVSVTGTPIPGVSVVASSANDQMQSESNSDGSFEIGNIPGCDEFNLIMTMTDVANKGINTLDLIKMQRFILGLGGLDSPYQMLAADINRSGSITTIDLLMVRKLILGIETGLEEDGLWMFMPEGYTFENELEPYKEQLPEYMELGVMMDTEREESFLGFKLGDVDFSAFPAQAAPRSANELLLSFNEQAIKAGESYELVLSAQNAKDLLGMQLSLGFDPTAMQLKGLTSEVLTGLTAQNYALKDGSLRMSWNQQEAVEVTEGAPLLSIGFTALRNAQLSELIYLDRAVQAEAYDAQETTSDIRLDLGTPEVLAEEAFELYQNRPNPFTSETTIPLYIEKGGEVTLTVFDILGRSLLVRKSDLGAGYHEIRLTAQDLPQTGTMFYQIETAEGILTKEMIRQ
jgi:hypothetical protein